MVSIKTYLQAQECKDDIDLVALFSNSTRDAVLSLKKSQYDKLAALIPFDELTKPIVPLPFILDDITVNQWFILQTEDKPLLKLAYTFGYNDDTPFDVALPVVMGFCNALINQQLSGRISSLRSLTCRIKAYTLLLKLQHALLTPIRWFRSAFRSLSHRSHNS